MRAGAIALVALLATACAAVPRPDVLAETDQVSRSAGAEVSKTYAPAAFAHAEMVRHEAAEAFSRGDLAGSQILGENALAAYANAAALARIARAERAEIDANAKLRVAQGELGTLEAEQARAAADADALELQVRVARDAQPIVASGRVDPERERARLAAARALTMQARLLCAAARLLAASPRDAAKPADPKASASLDEAVHAVDKVEDELKPDARLAPIDEATRARAGCLAALTQIRRTATSVSKAPGAGDALLTELSALAAAPKSASRDALTPSRDDRGVVVTMRGIFQGESLNAIGQTQVAEIGRVAAAHPAFPVEIVVHGGTAAGDKARADALAKALVAAAGGNLRVDALSAAQASPVVDPNGNARARNARAEIVFVTPESF